MVVTVDGVEETKTVYLIENPPTVTVTQTYTVTPDVPTPMYTETWGRPWTTATPYIWTKTINAGFPSATGIPARPPMLVEVVNYPMQPTYTHCYQPRCRKAGTVAAAFFGGMGAGVIFLALVMFFRRLRKRVKERRARREGLVRLAEDASSDNYGVLFATPRGSEEDKVDGRGDIDVSLKGSGAEDAPLLGDVGRAQGKNADHERV